MNPLHALRERLLPADAGEALERVPVQVGSFGYDPWGYNKDRSRLAFALCKKLYDDYFRVAAHGLEHVPAEGRVLIVGNHSGQLPMDGIMVAVAVATSPAGPRAPRAMIERFFPTVPFVGNALNHLGGVLGDPVNCARMLEREEAIIVFPEGVRGSGKPYRLRYQLQRFGQGFMHLAVEHHTPIVPVGVVGCEETMPSLGNFAALARLLGLPYFPVSPLLPLPARVVLNFGRPMRFAGPLGSEGEVQARVEQVKEAIGGLIRDGLQQRESIF